MNQIQIPIPIEAIINLYPFRTTKFVFIITPICDSHVSNGKFHCGKCSLRESGITSISSNLQESMRIHGADKINRLLHLSNSVFFVNLVIFGKCRKSAVKKNWAFGS